MPVEYSLAAVPAAYGLGLAPHVYYLGRMMFASGFAWSNVSYVIGVVGLHELMSTCSPRQNWDALKAKVPADVYNRCLRARGAHLNAMETFPLFAVAMVRSTSFCKFPRLLPPPTLGADWLIFNSWRVPGELPRRI
jgi:hypothetical protein